MPLYPLESYRQVLIEKPRVAEKRALSATTLSIASAAGPLFAPVLLQTLGDVSALVAAEFEDITRQLGSSAVEVEESDEEIDRMTFTIKHGAIKWLETMRIGQRVRFFGGYKQEVVGVRTRRFFLEGVISRWTPLFTDTGRIEVRVTVEPELFHLTRNRPGRVTYPSDTPAGLALYRRTFHLGRPSLSILEIVLGIVGEYGIPVGHVKIDPEYNLTFTKAAPISQNEDESDYHFLLRLVTGRSEHQAPGRSRGVNPAEKENPYVNAHARLFMEFDVKQGRSVLHVIPEKDLLTQTGPVKFLYQTESGRTLDPGKYDPLAKDAELIMENVNLNDDPDAARGREQLLHKDVSGKGGATSGSNKQPQQEQQQDENSPGSIEEEWEIDEAQVQRDLKSGVLTIADAQELLGGRRLTEAEQRRYVITRETVFPGSDKDLSKDPAKNRNTASAGSKDASSTDGAAGLGTGGGGRGSGGAKKATKRVKPPKVRRFGKTLTFETHGNIYVLCRRSYTVDLAVGRYSGNWYAYKVKHSFGNTYRMHVEMGR